MKVKSYRIIKRCCSSIEFQKEIQALIDDGWQPYGDLIFSIGSGTRDDVYVQAVVKDYKTLPTE